MSHEIKKLLPRHKRIMEFCLEGMKTYKQIAQEVMLTPRAVSYIVNSPLFEQELHIRRRAMERESDRANVLASFDRAHGTGAETPDEGVRPNTVKEMLARFGL